MDPQVTNPYLGAGDQSQIRVIHATDGTDTEVAVYVGDKAIGTGTARRRTGETRNPYLGMVIAAARAYDAASEHYAEIARSAGIDPFEKESQEALDRVMAALGEEATALLDGMEEYAPDRLEETERDQ